MKITINNFISRLSLSLFCILLSGNINAQTSGIPTAIEISTKSANIIEYKDIEMVITLKIYNKEGSERIRKLLSVSKEFDNITKMLLRFIEPADYKGTTMLIYDYKTKSDDMWIYLPSLRKTRRVAGSEKGRNFMGSEFTNADMSKPNQNDFSFNILGEETCNGSDCWKIESIPLNNEIAKENGFSRKISYIDKKSFMCYKIETYDMKKELFKREQIRQYTKISEGKYLACYMEMENIQDGRKSIILIDKFKKGVLLTESHFSPTELD